MSATLLVIGALVAAISGAPALLAPRGSRLGSRSSTGLLIAGCAIGEIAAVVALAGRTSSVSAHWAIPGGALSIRLDALSAFFVAPLFLIAAAGALYGERYWPASRERAAYIRTFFGLVTAALAIMMSAENTLLFLASWEIVAVVSFLLVATDDDDPAVRSAAWIYLAAGHVATLALFGLFTLLHSITGRWTFAAIPIGIGAPAVRAIFWLALVGFGVKAGLMPFHIWLPGAHAAAPSHVSAMMSGVVIKMGIYGLVRLLSLFAAPPSWFGVVLLAAGIVSSVLGVAFALAQHDLKRLLAYHSIENIGIIVTGLGIGTIARAHGAPAIALMGYAGALLHVWNHGLFKSLLFLGGGAAVHATHTREIDRMGGLAKRMPWTAAAFLTGAVAICGLPPLNGFVSEWLLYFASFSGMQQASPASWTLVVVLVAPALALTGALALACFVKAFGAVFLGTARSDAARDAVEVPATMRAAMAPLAICCAAIGLVPVLFMTPLAGAANVASGAEVLRIVAVQARGADVLVRSSPKSGRARAAERMRRPLPSPSLPRGAVAAGRREIDGAVAEVRSAAAQTLPASTEAGVLHDVIAPVQTIAIVVALLALAAFFALRKLTGDAPRRLTWDCGYAAPTSRMQYTSSSFARTLAGFFAWVMPPVVREPRRLPLFPAHAEFESHVPDTVLDRGVLPAVRIARRAVSVVRFVQSGRVQLYLLYVGATLVLLLFWSFR